MKTALSGIRVIGITNWLSGAYAEQLLADMGAEVIRVERPKAGDDARNSPPFYNGESTVYLYPNRNKKSVTINLKDPAGVDMLKRLVATADVVIENNRPGTLDKLGVGYEVLKEIRPDLVMTSISGFGQTGPYRNLPAYDMNMQAVTGLMSLTGTADGPPLRTGVAISDYLAGLNAAYATLVALMHRAKTGEGQQVDVSLYESAVAVFGTALQDYLLMGKARGRSGNRFGSVAPSNIYPCVDGWVLITAANDAQWRRLAQIPGLAEVLNDPRFNSLTERAGNQDELDRLIECWTQPQTVAAAVAQLTAAGVPGGPVNTIPDLVADSHFKSRGIAVEVEHPTAGPIRLVAAMPKLSVTPGRVLTPPPALGQHNREVFGELLGLGDAELQALAQAGIV
jgi:CoA:oxalate CoA-transferase